MGGGAADIHVWGGTRVEGKEVSDCALCWCAQGLCSLVVAFLVPLHTSLDSLEVNDGTQEMVGVLLWLLPLSMPVVGGGVLGRSRPTIHG